MAQETIPPPDPRRETFYHDAYRQYAGWQRKITYNDTVILAGSHSPQRVYFEKLVEHDHNGSFQVQIRLAGGSVLQVPRSYVYPDVPFTRAKFSLVAPATGPDQSAEIRELVYGDNVDLAFPNGDLHTLKVISVAEDDLDQQDSTVYAYDPRTKQYYSLDLDLVRLNTGAIQTSLQPAKAVYGCCPFRNRGELIEELLECFPGISTEEYLDVGDKVAWLTDHALLNPRYSSPRTEHYHVGTVLSRTISTFTLKLDDGYVVQGVSPEDLTAARSVYDNCYGLEDFGCLNPILFLDPKKFSKGSNYFHPLIFSNEEDDSSPTPDTPKTMNTSLIPDSLRTAHSNVLLGAKDATAHATVAGLTGRICSKLEEAGVPQDTLSHPIVVAAISAYIVPAMLTYTAGKTAGKKSQIIAATAEHAARGAGSNQTMVLLTEAQAMIGSMVEDVMGEVGAFEGCLEEEPS